MRTREQIEYSSGYEICNTPERLILEVLLDIRDLLKPQISKELDEWNDRADKGIPINI